MRGADVGADGGLQQLSQRHLVIRQWLHRSTFPVDGACEARRAEGAATQDVRQHGRTQHVLDKQRNDVGELVFTEGVT